MRARAAVGADITARKRSLHGRDGPASSGLAHASVGLDEDRNADYKRTNVLTLIADNCWNAGVVLGSEAPLRADQSLVGVLGALEINGKEAGSGATDDPLAALAWLANLNAELGCALTAGMVVITGSVIPTLPIARGDRFVFRLAGLRSTELTAI